MLKAGFILLALLKLSTVLKDISLFLGSKDLLRGVELNFVGKIIMLIVLVCLFVRK